MLSLLLVQLTITINLGCLQRHRQEDGRHDGERAESGKLYANAVLPAALPLLII